MRLSALSLALFLPSLAFGDGGYLMGQASKDESLKILNELEQNLTGLKQALQTATDNSMTLNEDLQTALQRLDNSEKLLREAKQNLEASESNLSAVKLLLDQAQKALIDSERSFKDYQRSELLRMVGVGAAGLAIGILTGWGIAHFF